MSASKPFESTRNIVLGGDRRATTIALFPVNGGVAGIATDAEEKVDLRERLQQHVNAHDKLLNAMDEAVVIFGPDKTVKFNNAAFRNIFGLDENWSRDDRHLKRYFVSIRMALRLTKLFAYHLPLVDPDKSDCLSHLEHQTPRPLRHKRY